MTSEGEAALVFNALKHRTITATILEQLASVILACHLTVVESKRSERAWRGVRWIKSQIKKTLNQFQASEGDVKLKRHAE